MTKLSDTQTIILSRAAQNESRIALPLPESLRGGAAAKVVGALLSKGFLEEADANMRKGEPVWREAGDGHGVTLVATDAGLEAIGIEIEPAAEAPTSADDTASKPAGKGRGKAERKAANGAAAGATGRPREDTKQARLITMLRRPEGATIAQIIEVTNWQAHTVRGAFAGALKKKLGLTVTSEKVDGKERVYRLP